MNKSIECRGHCRASYPTGLNLTERYMIQQLYEAKIWRKYRDFLLIVLLGTSLVGCIAHADVPTPQPPQPPQPVCQYVIGAVVINSIKADGSYIVSYNKSSFNTQVCACTDGIVRWGAYCNAAY